MLQSLTMCVLSLRDFFSRHMYPLPAPIMVRPCILHNDKKSCHNMNGSFFLSHYDGKQVVRVQCHVDVHKQALSLTDYIFIGIFFSAQLAIFFLTYYYICSSFFAGLFDSLFFGRFWTKKNEIGAFTPAERPRYFFHFRLFLFCFFVSFKTHRKLRPIGTRQLFVRSSLKCISCPGNNLHYSGPPLY